MRRAAIMLVAGEASGDANAAALVRALAAAIPAAQFQITAAVQPLTTPLAPSFFGGGGPKMAGAGVELTEDFTADAVIGLGGLVNKMPMLRRRMREMIRLAVTRQPDLIILVDYGGFNLRLARAIKQYVATHAGPFFNWRPKIVQFISPQVWASRPGRANQMAQRYDLVLSLFPFEKKWYAERVPDLPVEFIGHPMFDLLSLPAEFPPLPVAQPPVVLLLPGSRQGELKRHLPVMREAAGLMAARQTMRFKMVLPNEPALAFARQVWGDQPPQVEFQIGGLTEALPAAALALSKTGTIALECACFGVPAVAFYKADWITYAIGRQLVNVKYLTMPNLLAGEAVYPEFVQGQATPANLAAAALEILNDPKRRAEIRARLAVIVRSLGGPGAAQRAAAALIRLMRWG